jgi:hypothetical protein
MSKFAVPQPGAVITVTTRYKSAYYLSETGYDETTYSHVPVLQPQSWTKPDCFCIPAENEPFITFRTISIDRVTALEVHEGESAPTDLRHGTHHVPVKGSGDKVYTVVVVDGVGKKCDCLGFQYRSDCRHLRMATGEHPVNPRRETVKKQKRKAAAAKRKPRKAGAPTKADKVRDIIRGRKLAMKDNKPETNELVKQWCITDAIERVGMSRSLATTYVKNNWSKV